MAQQLLNYIAGCIRQCPPESPQKHFHFTEEDLARLGIRISLETPNQWNEIVSHLRQYFQATRPDIVMDSRYQPNAPTNLARPKRMGSLTFTFRRATYVPVEGIDD